MDLHAPWRSCGGQRSTCRNWLSPSTLWAPRIKHGSWGLVASASTSRATTPPSWFLVFLNVWLSYHLDFYINFRIYLSLKKTSVTWIWMTLDVQVSKIYEYQRHIKVSLLRWSSFLCSSVCWQFFEGCCFLHFFFHSLVSVEVRMVCLYQTSSLVQGSVQ